MDLDLEDDSDISLSSSFTSKGSDAEMYLPLGVLNVQLLLVRRILWWLWLILLYEEDDDVDIEHSDRSSSRGRDDGLGATLGVHDDQRRGGAALTGALAKQRYLLFFWLLMLSERHFHRYRNAKVKKNATHAEERCSLQMEANREEDGAAGEAAERNGWVVSCSVASVVVSAVFGLGL